MSRELRSKDYYEHPLHQSSFYKMLFYLICTYKIQREFNITTPNKKNILLNNLELECSHLCFSCTKVTKTLFITVSVTVPYSKMCLKVFICISAKKEGVNHIQPKWAEHRTYIYFHIDR